MRNDEAILMPAGGPSADSVFQAVAEALQLNDLAPDPTMGFVETDDSPKFGDLDFGLALQEQTQSLVPGWLEGSDSLVKLEGDPESVPNELLEYGTLSQGVDPSVAELEKIQKEAGSPLKADIGTIAGPLIALGAIVLLFAAAGRQAPSRRYFHGGKAGW